MPDFGKVEQQLPGEDQTAGALEVLEHTLRIDQELLDQRGGFGKQVVRQDGRVRKNDALDRGVRDVALMPKSYIFERRLGIGTQHPRQPADLL